MSFSFPQQLPSLFFEPRRYRPHGVGYWSGHIPFACDLVHTLRPQTFVELGTHTGESYFAFCQAIEQSALSCKASAVDTWRGDQHTGAYSERVFDEVRQCNEQYRQFSTLLRSTFDEAAPQFAEQSIDLLHIDGAHIYEAVRHDFETWWPKIRDGGVVVMHDSNERGHDFGVWRYLQELRQRFPAEEFLQSHGLAVVVKPPLPAESNAATALITASAGDLQSIRRYYEMCSAFQRHRYFSTQRKTDEWEVNAQVFWRGEGETFSESRSVRAAEIVGGQGETLLLPIGDHSKPVVELRVIPSLEPALLTVKGYRLEDSRGQAISQADGVPSLVRWRERGLQAAAGVKGAIVFDKTGSNGFTISPGSEVRGGRLYLDLSGMDPFDCAAEVTTPHSRPLSLWSRLFARP